MNHPVVIVNCNNIMSLPIIRSLGGKDIHITAVFGTGKNRIFYQDIIAASKFINEIIFFDESEYEKNLINLLSEYGNNLEHKPVLFIASDTDLEIISKNRDTLLNNYLFSLPSHEIIEKLLRKEEFISLAVQKGFDIPYSVKIDSLNGLDNIDKKFKFPFIIKPSWRNNEWLNIFKEKKLFVINSMSDLEFFREIGKNIKFNFLIQEIIPGSEENIFCTFSILDKNSEIITIGCCKKIRQYPKNFGNTSIAAVCLNTELEKLTRDIARKLKAVGYLSIEFKFDPSDSKFKIIEITPNRFNRQFLVTEIAGLNLPYSLYLMETGHSDVKPERKNKKGYWLSEVNEIRTFKNYKNDFSILNYFRTLIGVRKMEILSFKDLRPFLKFFSKGISYFVRQEKKIN